MAVNYTDFDKIWASTSPLTPYEFSESQYKEGWNFIGATPPSRQMWDFLQKNNDEKMQYLADNYLPLSGGTMTGAISRSGTFVKNIDDTSAVLFNAGTDNSGSYIGMWAKNNAISPGVIQLRCSDGTNSTMLVCYPNGTLLWGGKEVERVNASSFGTTSYIRYESGLQIVYRLGITITATAMEITYPVAFVSIPATLLTVNGNVNAYVTSASSTKFNFNVTQTAQGLIGEYIAIGQWK